MNDIIFGSIWCILQIRIKGRTINIWWEHAKDHQVPSRWSRAHPPTSEVQGHRHLHVPLQRKWIHSTPNYLRRRTCDWGAARLPTLRVFSTSPQGSLFTKSMPVRGVPVGGNSTEASIIRYSTFNGLLCIRRVHGQADVQLRSEGFTSPDGRQVRTHWPSCSCIHPQTCPERSPRPGINLKEGEAESHWLTVQWFWNYDNIHSSSFIPCFLIVPNIETIVDRKHDSNTNIITHT